MYAEVSRVGQVQTGGGRESYSPGVREAGQSRRIWEYGADVIRMKLVLNKED